MKSERILKIAGCIVLVQGILLAIGIFMIDRLEGILERMSEMENFKLITILIATVYVVSGTLTLLDKKYIRQVMFIPITIVLGLFFAISVLSLLITFIGGLVMLAFYGTPFISFIMYFSRRKEELRLVLISDKKEKISKTDSKKIYDMAIDFIKKEKYDLALLMFKRISNYKDAKKQIDIIEKENKLKSP